MSRLTINKTFKLYINGAFPRSESGRSLVVRDGEGAVVAHVCHASRKDLRDAVEAAAGRLPQWAAATAYNRGQILYRMAEMLEGKREDFVQVVASGGGGVAAARREVEAAIDRLVVFCGWADKLCHVLGGQNQVAGPYYNLTVPEPTGVVAVIAPDEPSLLGLVSLIAPPLCAGNTIVALSSEKHPLPAALFAEVCATSDVPPGAINILTGQRQELLEPIAAHRELNAVSAANLKPAQARVLEGGVAENLKRVVVTRRPPRQWYDEQCDSPWTIEPFVEMKTIWHPSAT
jgi:acyl-CoA reductase-like NAD-dependent aldehyde dehydrogenase